MAFLDREILVDAPREICFDLLQSERLVEWLIGLESIYDIEGEEGVGRH